MQITYFFASKLAILDGMEGKLNTSKWAKMTQTSPATDLRDIQELIQKEVLRASGEGGRNTNYILQED